jgi:hypothetical protein
VSARTKDNIHSALTGFIFSIVKDNYILKDIYMMFLLHINDDFDDDLLLDAMELLVDL